MFKAATEWIKERTEERSTAFGIVLIGVGIVVLFPAILKLGALAAIVYGIITIAKKDK